MGLPRILFYVVVRLLAVLVAGFGFAWDATGGSWFSFSMPSGGNLVGLIAFGAFVVMTGVREINLLLQSRPRVAYVRPLPTHTATRYPKASGILAQGEGYFVRLSFQNKARVPSGRNSTAQKLAAKIRLFLIRDEQIDENEPVDAWDGRWAITNEPSTK